MLEEGEVEDRSVTENVSTEKGCSVVEEERIYGPFALGHIYIYIWQLGVARKSPW